MDFTNGVAHWLPVLIQDETTGDGIEGIAFDDAGLLLTYQKPGGDVTTITPTAEQWIEGHEGVYQALYPASAFDTEGVLLYWSEYTDALVYPGAVEVLAAGATPVIADPRLTVAEAKFRLNIAEADTSLDDYLGRAIPDLIEYADEYCNRAGEWLEEDATLPGGVKQFVCQAARYLEDDPGATQVRLGDASFAQSAVFPPAITMLLKPYCIARFA